MIKIAQVLGATEAGLFPGTVYVFSVYYRRYALITLGNNSRSMWENTDMNVAGALLFSLEELPSQVLLAVFSLILLVKWTV